MSSTIRKRKWSVIQVLTVIFLVMFSLIVVSVGIVFVFTNEGILTFSTSAKVRSTNTNEANSQRSLPPTWTASLPISTSTKTPLPPITITPTPHEEYIVFTGKPADYIPPKEALPQNFYLNQFDVFNTSNPDEAIASYTNQQPVYNQTDDIYLVIYNVYLFSSENNAIKYFESINNNNYFENQYWQLIISNQKITVSSNYYEFPQTDSSNFFTGSHLGGNLDSPGLANFVIVRKNNILVIITTLSFNMTKNSLQKSQYQTVEFVNILIEELIK